MHTLVVSKKNRNNKTETRGLQGNKTDSEAKETGTP